MLLDLRALVARQGDRRRFADASVATGIAKGARTARATFMALVHGLVHPEPGPELATAAQYLLRGIEASGLGRPARCAPLALDAVACARSTGPPPIDCDIHHSGDDERARWSPDGSQLVFMRFSNGTFQFLRINSDGTGEVQLTHSASNETYPWWAR